MERTCAIVLNYFGLGRTRTCLQSLLGEPLGRIYLVDNSATEEQRRGLENLASEADRVRGSRVVRTVFNQENLGFGRAVNQVIAMDGESCASHERYWLVNNDVQVQPGTLVCLDRSMSATPRTALVSPRVLWGGQEVCSLWYQRHLGAVSGRRTPGAFPYLPGCCLLVRGSLVRDGGLFDEDFFMYGEDVELAWRAARLGWQAACAHDATVTHEGSGSSRRGSFFYECHVARGHLLLGRKLARSVSEETLLMAGRVGFLALRAISRSLRYRSFSPLWGTLAAWRSLPGQRAGLDAGVGCGRAP